MMHHYEVEMITYYDHSRKVYEYTEGWLKRATENTLTITSIGAVVYEDDRKVVLAFDFESDKVDMNEILKSAITERKKVGKVYMVLIE